MTTRVEEKFRAIVRGVRTRGRYGVVHLQSFEPRHSNGKSTHKFTIPMLEYDNLVKLGACPDRRATITVTIEIEPKDDPKERTNKR